jgi:hypothetical protein
MASVGIGFVQSPTIREAPFMKRKRSQNRVSEICARWLNILLYAANWGLTKRAINCQQEHRAKLAITFLSAMILIAVSGCLNLSKDVVLSTEMLKTNPPPPKEQADAALPPGTPPPPQAPASILVPANNEAKTASTEKEGSSPASSSTAIPDRYSGLEILNRAAGNGRGTDPALATLETSQIKTFQRAIPPKEVTPGKEASEETRTIVIQYSDADEAPLNAEFLSDSNVKKVLEATRQNINKTGASGSSINVLTARKMAEKLATSVKTIHSDTNRQSKMLDSLKSIQKVATGDATNMNVRLDAIACAYMQAYLEGKFVDRNGTTISQPDIAQKLGGDTLTSFETVLLEAVYDYATLTPIVYTKSNSTPSDVQGDQADASSGKSGGTNTPPSSGSSNSKATPTFALLFPEFYQPVSTDSDAPGVTSAELKLMTLLQGLGGEETKHLSGAIIKFFGGVAAGAKLSVGDNDSVPKTVSTLCNAFVSDTVGTLSYDFFEKYCYTNDSDGNYWTDYNKCKANNLYIDKPVGDAIAAALQYENILSTLLDSTNSAATSKPKVSSK